VLLAAVFTSELFAVVGSGTGDGVGAGADGEDFDLNFAVDPKGNRAP
jgi:hypothetical protein